MREEDHLGRRVPSQLGGAEVWFRAVPGLAGQFRKQVPKSHLRRPHSDPAVACTCKAVTPIKDKQGRIVECDGGCSRFFLPLSTDEVWVAGPYADDDGAA